MARGRAKEPSNALVASATRIKLRDPKAAAAQAAKRQEWQTEAWAYFDEVPEIKESIRYRANQVAKVRLFVAVANPDDPEGDPIPVTAEASGVPPAVAEAAQAELDRLRSRQGGQPQIMRTLDMNLEVAGEAWIIGYGEHTESIEDPVTGVKSLVTVPEDWQVKSVAEVEVKMGKYFVKAAPGDTQPKPVNPETDTAFRVWEPHPQWGNMADSAMRGLLGECKVLQALCQQQLAETNSHQSAGVFTLPNELSFGPANPTEEDADDPEADPFMAEMLRALTEPIGDPASASSVAPMLIRGPAEFLTPDYLRHFTLGRVDDGTLDSRIEARVLRIARGLSLPVEKVTGLAKTTFANAAMVDQDEYDDYLRPSVDRITEMLTFVFLSPQLVENMAVPDEWAALMFVASDPSALITQPDTEANADGAWDRFAISDATYRKAKGYGEDDAATDEEIAARAERRRGITNNGQPMTVTPVVASARRSLRAATSPDYGRLLAAIDTDLRTRVVVASNAAMTRALDKAASRLRSKTNGTELRAQLRNVPARDVFRHLGATLVAQVLGDDDPFAGGWDELESQWRTWAKASQTDALDTAARAAGGFSVAERDALMLRQAEDLDQAWVWMRDSLQSLGGEQLFSPDPNLPSIGEFDPTAKVPTGLVRQAIARAGGQTGLTTSDGTGAWVTIADGGTRPAGGIGTGELLHGAMRDHGVLVEGYIWDYGPAFRKAPFRPHLDLDGQPFQNFDDAVLTSDGTFGFGFWMPGDHAGCVCNAVPVLLAADEVS